LQTDAFLIVTRPNQRRSSTESLKNRQFWAAFTGFMQKTSAHRISGMVAACGVKTN